MRHKIVLRSVVAKLLELFHTVIHSIRMCTSHTLYASQHMLSISPPLFRRFVFYALPPSFHSSLCFFQCPGLYAKEMLVKRSDNTRAGHAPGIWFVVQPYSCKGHGAKHAPVKYQFPFLSLPFLTWRWWLARIDEERQRRYRTHTFSPNM